MNNAIEVKNVTKIYKLYNRNRDRLIDSLGLSKTPHYREHYALNNLSFEVKKGECVGIIGTNGAGKSTILKIITGVLNPSLGNINIDGRISALLELGAGFNVEYTGIENIYLNGTMIGFSREEIDAKMQEILDFADIGDFVYQPVKTYSSGMFVRLAFAIAINIDPEILIVDEALSVGDVFFQAKCFRKFDEFKKSGRTILFVSHDLSSIQTYCDRAILLNKGQKIAEDKPGKIIDLYKRILVGEDPENLMKKDAPLDEAEANKDSASSKEAGHENAPHPSLRDLQEYGDKKAEIVDYSIIDNSGKCTSTLMKGEEFTVRMTVVAHEDIEDPICAFTIRNTKGIDICGTNTMVEKVPIGSVRAGEKFDVTFKQNLDIQGGNYLVCLGLTRFERDDFFVYHRLYDCMNIEVVSTKNTVGFYDCNSVVNLER